MKVKKIYIEPKLETKVIDFEVIVSISGPESGDGPYVDGEDF